MSAEQGVAARYRPLYLLDHVKTPNKETGAPLLLNRCRCYVVVSVIIHLNALCWSGGGVAFPLEGYCFSTLPKMLLERVGSCCRDLSCLTLEGLLIFSPCRASYHRCNCGSTFNVWITNITRKLSLLQRESIPLVCSLQ